MTGTISLRGGRRLAAILVSLTLLAGGTAAAQDKASLNDNLVKGVSDSFRSGGRTIKVQRFDPAGGLKRPAVVFLHGSDGWEQMKAYRFAATPLVESGHVVVLIRYYDRTGTPDQVPADQRAEFTGWLEGKRARDRDSKARKLFDDWVETVGDAAAYCRGLPDVDADRIGLVGFSLGGYLAISAGARKDYRFSAVVEMLGALAEEHRSRLAGMPPALLINCAEDHVVPVKDCFALLGTLKHFKCDADAVIYPKLDHFFIPPGREEPDPLALLDARARMAKFINKHHQISASASPPVKTR